MKYLILLLVLILSACAVSNSRQANPPVVNSASLSSPSPTPNVSSAAQDSPIRSIDFKNFTYDWYPADYDVPATGKKIILKNGSMDTGFSYGQEPRQFFLIGDGVKYGDLTEDGNEEALVVLGIITSGTARHNLIFVYTTSNERPKRLWVFETGDRWDYGYHDALIKNGQLLIEQYKPKIIEYQGQKHDMSQSDTYIRDYYKWDGTQFRKIKTEELPIDTSDSNPWASRGT